MAKTVKVRIAVGVDSSGDWNAYGGTNMDDAQAMSFAVECIGGGESRYWITAELTVPEETDVAGDLTVVD